MGVKIYTGSRATAKADAKFRTKNGGISANARITKQAIIRIKALNPGIKDISQLLRLCIEEIKKIDKNDGSHDAFFAANVESYAVQKLGRRTQPFTAANGAWRKTGATRRRSGPLDSVHGPGSRADRAVVVDRMAPAGSKKVDASYKKKVSKAKIKK